MRAIIFTLIALIAGSAAAEESAKPPQWFLDEISAMTADGGRWIADNKVYKNDNETFDAYGIEWVSGFNGATMTGRLFGIRDGKETSNFWEFRQYWHPGRKQGVLEQFGWGGVVGIGVLTSGEDGETITDQEFFSVDGSLKRVGHISRFTDANTHEGGSYDIIDGDWIADRQYVWKRQSPDKK
ncbi:MAG: hypothetical protein R3C51_06490 [Parvularculaceae bacterium]